MTNKPRRIDFYPDEYIAGVSGRLSAEDQGIYWMVCSLIYSRGEPIDDDHVWLSRLFVDGTHWRTVRAAVDRLIRMGKIERSEGGKISVKRCARELQKARTTIAGAVQNGRKGGRPSNENKEIEKADGSFSKKLTDNHQPINPSSSLRSEEENLRPHTKPAKRRLSYPEAFEAFWREYPTDKLMSKKQAAEAWSRLPDEDRAKAKTSLPAFRQHCSQHPDYRPVHAVRYLSQRRFDGFAELVEQTRSQVWIKQGTPQWAAWDRHWRETKGGSPPVDKQNGWRFPSEFPPGLTVVKEAKA